MNYSVELMKRVVIMNHIHAVAEVKMMNIT
jgi:hypothetical protein